MTLTAVSHWKHCRCVAVHSDNYWALEAEESDELRRLQSSKKGKLSSAVQTQAVLLCILVVINGNDLLIKAYSQSRSQASGESYSPSCVIAVTCISSVLLGNILAFVKPSASESRLDAVRKCWSLHQILRMGLPAALFTLSATLKFVAVAFVAPGTAMAIDQTGLILGAVLGVALLKKQYTGGQWAALLFVTACLFIYMQAHGHSNRSKHEDSDGPGSSLGLLLCVLEVVVGCLGGLSCELLLKSNSHVPFFVSKSHMEVAGSLAALFSCLVLEPIFFGSCSLLERGMFAGWDSWTLAVACLALAKSWLAGMVVCLLDTTAYSLAGTMAMVLVYAESLFLLSEDPREDFDLCVCLAVLLLATAVASFALVSAAAGKRRMLACKTAIHREVTQSSASGSSLKQPLLKK